MTVRSFDWRDIAVLHRYRSQSVFLNSALVLTRGPLLMPSALFSFLAPSMGVFTCVADEAPENDSPVIGQFIRLPGSQFAHLTFLAPDTALETKAVLALLDYMAAISGDQGIFRLLADVDECTLAYEILRRAGFAIYSRQRIWKSPEPLPDRSQTHAWRAANSQDAIPVRSLYNNLVPGLVQQVEPFVAQRPHGMVYYNSQGDLLAYAEVYSGHRGIWVQPLIHPEAEDVAACLMDLLHRIPNRFSQPIYICVRSHQAWLESRLEELGAEVGSPQAVMVKHLAVQQKALRPFALPSLETGHPDLPAPVTHIEIEGKT